MTKQTIKFWCPEVQKNVVCDCEVTETGMVSIQVAVPQDCEKKDCTCGHDCLIGEDIQGNFGLELEAQQK